MKQKNKLYVIIAIGVTGCGGGQLYIRNKCVYLESLGWNVKVLSFSDGKIYIKYFEKHKGDIDTRFSIPSYLYTKRQVQSIIDSHLDGKKSYDECIVESSANFLGSWGEIIAEKLHAKHWIYSLDEHSKDYPFYRDFLKFKFERKEYATIAADVLSKNLPFLKIDAPEQYRLSAYCNNSIDNIEDCIQYDLKSNVKIGILGRLNKDYVIPVTNDLTSYIRSHSELTFDVVYIGDSPKRKDVSNVIKAYKNIPNAHVFVTGYVCPIPLSFLQKFDFFIATAGSARALCRNKLLVISMDGYKFKSNGILSLQTKKTLVPDEVQYELSESLDDLIIRKKYTTEQLSFEMPDDLGYYFDAHMRFIKESTEEHSLEYYDIKCIKLPFHLKVCKCMLAIIGAKKSARIKLMMR